MGLEQTRWYLWILIIITCCLMVLITLSSYSSDQLYGKETAESQVAQTYREVVPRRNKKISGVTNAKHSTVYIVNPRKDYRICDRLDIIIEARDDGNNLKINGGDYIRVRIYNSDLQAGSSSDGEIVYLGGGKYKASFTLRWTGQTFVHAILVHPAEAVNVLRRARDNNPTRYGYFGRFTRTIGSRSVVENTLCNIVPPSSSASFTSRWGRHASARAVLADPSKVVDLFRDVKQKWSPDYCPTKYFGSIAGTGIAGTGSRSVIENDLCKIGPPSPNDTICDLTRHAIKAPWFCIAPAKLNCSDFAWTCANKKYSAILVESSMTEAERLLFERQKQPIPARGANFVAVTERDKNISSPTHCYNEGLPPCGVGSFSLSNPMAAGYFYKGQWHSNYCRLRVFQVSDTLKCLTNKTVYFHGDSTSRQYYEYLVKTLRSTLKPNPPTIQPNWKVGPSLAEDKAHNFTVHYRHHGYPIRNNWTYASEVQFIEEALDALQATPDTVFMFTIWAHLTSKNLSFYENRVRRIRAAVERLHRRSPDTLVIIKSANTREHLGAGASLTASDWYARELDKKLREVFRSYDKKIGFIDQWSMVVGYSNTDAIHPDKGVISSGIRTLLSYICPK